MSIAQTTKVSSVYTNLGSRNCKELTPDTDNGELYRGQCPGVGGYKLIFLEGEHSQTLDVLAPTGEVHELDLAQRLSAAPAFLGGTVEWRALRGQKGPRPIALIVRLNVLENPENPEARTSYLIVAKIGPKTSCVTDIVNPGARQNVKARELADIAENKVCVARN